MLAVAASAWLLPGVSFSGALPLLAGTVALGVVNTLLRPALHLITFPISVVTLGMFGFVINALLVMLAATLVPGFLVAGFWWALAFSLTLGLVSWALHLVRLR